jgi:tetratricopeptide (TPR) repeat protein
MDTSQQLKTAYKTAKAGDRPRARQLIKEVLEVEPNNDAAWFLYARIAGDMQKSIYCLKKVLEINPSHALAKQDLEKLSPDPQNQISSSHSRPAIPEKQQPLVLPGWVWVAVAGCIGIVAFACGGYIIFANAVLPSPQASVAITQQPLVLSTPTNDCTCSQATSYLDETFARVDTLSTQITSIEDAYDEGALFQLNFATFSSEARAIYKEQLGEVPPSCLQAFQNKTVSLLWNWQQTMEYAATGQYDAADLFIQGFMDDFSALESEGERLLEEELNGCIMDPNSGPNL